MGCLCSTSERIEDEAGVFDKKTEEAPIPLGSRDNPGFVNEDLELDQFPERNSNTRDTNLQDVTDDDDNTLEIEDSNSEEETTTDCFASNEKCENNGLVSRYSKQLDNNQSNPEITDSDAYENSFSKNNDDDYDLQVRHEVLSSKKKKNNVIM